MMYVQSVAHFLNKLRDAQIMDCLHTSVVRLHPFGEDLLPARLQPAWFSIVAVERMCNVVSYSWLAHVMHSTSLMWDWALRSRFYYFNSMALYGHAENLASDTSSIRYTHQITQHSWVCAVCVCLLWMVASSASTFAFEAVCHKILSYFLRHGRYGIAAKTVDFSIR